VTRTQTAEQTTPIVVTIDAGERGNAGGSGYGVRIARNDGTLLDQFTESIGVAPTGVAEYRGLLAGLEWALTHGVTALHVRSDSLLLVQQMRANDRVKKTALLPLHARSRELARQIGGVTFEHLPREANVDASRLTNTVSDGDGQQAT
jgi:ribonuclease HI